MPPGGTLFRFFERFGENVPRSREASMPPLQQKRNVFGNRQTPIYLSINFIIPDPVKKSSTGISFAA